MIDQPNQRCITFAGSGERIRRPDAGENCPDGTPCSSGTGLFRSTHSSSTRCGEILAMHAPFRFASPGSLCLASLASGEAKRGREKGGVCFAAVFLSLGRRRGKLPKPPRRTKAPFWVGSPTRPTQFRRTKLKIARPSFPHAAASTRRQDAGTCGVRLCPAQARPAPPASWMPPTSQSRPAWPRVCAPRGHP
jgi:hypothetical protein